MEKGLIIASLVGSLAFILKELPLKILQTICCYIGFSFTTTSNDRESFLHINEWLYSLDKNILKNNINAKKIYIGDGSITNFSINYGKYIFSYNKCLVVVKNDCVEKTYDVVDKITIVAYGSIKNRNKIKEEIVNKINVNNNKNMIRIYPLPDNWDNYLSYKRSFNDVFIEDKNILINHIDKWANNKQFYNNHGIIYKLGILLYGSPGTGKSTTAKAIASHLNFNLHIINVKSYDEEQKLIKKIVSIPPKSVILFEDIDCLIGDRENKDDKNTKPLLGTILNILDGVMSPEEVIFIATTNHIESLDKALIRDGRFDVKVNIDNIGLELAEKMCCRFNIDPKEINLYNEIFPINPAYLQNKIIKYKNN